MKTRCPNCHTLYEIDETTLVEADHAAVCCRCHQLFTAKPVDSLDTSAPPPASLDQPASPDQSKETLETAQPEIDRIALEIDTLAREIEKQHELDKEWDFIDRPTAAAVPLQIDPGAFTEPLPAALKITRASATSESSATPLVTPASVVGLLFLIMLAAAQLAWMNRTAVSQIPWVEPVWSEICGVLECNLPPGIETDRFTVITRELNPLAGRPNGLELKLSFTNVTDSAQPIPDLLLSLFDHRNTLVAERRFNPTEYLNPEPATAKPGQVIEARLLLQKPASGSSGFQLEFL